MNDDDSEFQDALSALGEGLRIVHEDMKVLEAQNFALTDSLKQWVLAESEKDGQPKEKTLSELNEYFRASLEFHLSRIADQNHNLSERIRARILESDNTSPDDAGNA